METTFLIIYTYRSRLIDYLILGNFNRNITKEYSLKKELIITTFIYWFFMTLGIINQIIFNIDYTEFTCGGYYFMAIRSVILIFVTMIYPLF